MVVNLEYIDSSAVGAGSEEAAVGGAGGRTEGPSSMLALSAICSASSSSLSPPRSRVGPPMLPLDALLLGAAGGLSNEFRSQKSTAASMNVSAVTGFSMLHPSLLQHFLDVLGSRKAMWGKEFTWYLSM
eukprot:CAMPEP_0118672766 /NCGR_PEP_ID=MMETSP0785-20121206/22722_1 /TAXON_ID=91992 /ORGANISM="Bolidomonas pacifica, Strain CCMP 1866" /LENGTH=128 /DNA_ID=CAMNT_0006567763 /DNA_START=245 /DNA_END=631 /DNA_ORIENTATION=-